MRVIPKTRFVIPSITLRQRLRCSLQRPTKSGFSPVRPAAYAHQTSDKVTVGAKSFDNEQLTAEAFGKKTDLLRYGVLPVLVVIENKRDKALDLRDLEVNLVGADGSHVHLGRPGRSSLPGLIG